MTGAEGRIPPSSEVCVRCGIADDSSVSGLSCPVCNVPMVPWQRDHAGELLRRRLLEFTKPEPPAWESAA